MKTAISLPDELLRQVDHLARKQRLSRSAFFRNALEAYVANREVDVTSQINAALDEIGEDPEHQTWNKATSSHALRRKP